MNREQVFGVIIMFLCCFGSGFLFLMIGLRADKSDNPVNFWAGKPVRSEWIKDITGYNKANARMWKCYSIPYFASAGLALLGCYHEWFIIGAMLVLILTAFPGIILLIRHYRKIEKRYIDSKKLDKIGPFC